jgi:hypothetical protein
VNLAPSLFGAQKQKKTGFLRISFFSCVFRRNFSQERGFGEVPGIPVFGRPQDFFAGIPAGQEFLLGAALENFEINKFHRNTFLMS